VINIRTGYVICKKCNNKIPLIVKCRIEAPILFTATCHKCKHENVYSYADIYEYDTESCRRAEEKERQLVEIIGTFFFTSIITSAISNVIEAITQLNNEVEEHE
jgi:hypothetical protein